jgi:multiple sugar transport system ATP-binding protein
MARIELRNVQKEFQGFSVIKGVDLQINDQEFVVFVGPSGCGKTTLLRMIAGLEEISGGDFMIDNVRANDVPPDKRGLAMVFQSYALYPHMTVADNIGFALKMAKVPKAEIDAKVREAAQMLQLDKLLDRRPKALSGGQRQRVAIGRAIVRNPKGFLLDEPLSNLDAALRVQMRTELVKLNRQLATTMIYVTHDQIEAMTMADRIVVLNAGRIEQVGSPLELYHNPANLFVAGFIGSPKMNMIMGEVTANDGRAVTVAIPDGRPLTVAADRVDVAPGATVTFGVRPEHMHVSQSGAIDGIADVVEHLGNETLVYVKRPDGSMLIVKEDDLFGIRAGEPVRLSPIPERAALFASDGNALVQRRFQLQ